MSISPMITSVKWLFTLFLCGLLLACDTEPERTPEAAVRATLAAIETAAEARSLSQFMEHVSDDYRDHQGRTKDDIQRLVQFQYIRNQKIHILTDIKSVEIDGKSASVELNAAMAGRPQELEKSLLGVRANTHSFSVLLRSNAEQQSWQITSVAWQRGWK